MSFSKIRSRSRLNYWLNILSCWCFNLPSKKEWSWDIPRLNFNFALRLVSFFLGKCVDTCSMHRYIQDIKHRCLRLWEGHSLQLMTWRAHWQQTLLFKHILKSKIIPSNCWKIKSQITTNINLKRTRLDSNIKS